MARQTGRAGLVAMLLLGLMAALGAADEAADPSKAVARGTVVDDAGQPVAGVRVRVLGKDAAAPVTTDDAGRFRMVLDVPRLTYATFIAADADGRRFGYADVSDTKGEEPLRLVLRSAAEVTIEVTDDSGAAVRDADVYVLIDMRQFTSGRTDAAGRWSGRVPRASRHWSIFARKAGVGFDYLDLGYPRPDDPPHAWPSRVALTLDGARSVRVRTLDRDGDPVAGVAVGPWTVQQPGKPHEINLSGTSELWPKTGADGTAVIDWLPAKFVRSISILAHDDHYYAPDQIWIQEKNPAETVTHMMLPRTTLSGRVTHRDGRPAPGILVHAEGHGGTSEYCRAYARTDADGRYRMTIETEMAYLVAVEDAGYAAPNISGLVVRADAGPVTGRDFVLGTGTLVRGRVTLGDDQRPAAHETITISALAGDVPKILRREGDTIHREVQLYRWVETDAQGEYQIRLGAGEWSIRGPIRTEPVTLTIPADDPPAQATADFHMPRPETGPLTVTVVDTNGQPIAGAKLSGRYTSFQARRWFKEATTDDHGRYTTERSLDPLVLFAETADGRRAGLARLDAETATAQVVVAPTASASGRLLDPQGIPLAAEEIRYGIRVYLGEPEKSPFMDAFGGVATTDAQGHYTLTGLIPGETWYATIHEDSHLRPVAELTPRTTEPIAVGDTRLAPPPKPYVPPTPDTRVADAFAAKADVPPPERVKNVLAEAGRMYTRPLLLFGRPNEPACRELYRLLYDEPATAETDAEAADRPKRLPDLRWEFELAALHLDRADVRQFARPLGVATAKGHCTLVVLDHDGAAAATYPLSLADGKLDAAALAEFLRSHAPPTRDAEQMLADALKQAKADNKRVFLIASASWCGPCRRLARFLTPFKAELERHYIFVKLDISRDKLGEDVFERCKGKREGGIPWYVILDADGTERVTSNLPATASRRAGTNMGFPTLPPEIDHFLTMLRDTAPHLPAERLAAMRAMLEKK